jgi:hypothetical protein
MMLTRRVPEPKIYQMLGAGINSSSRTQIEAAHHGQLALRQLTLTPVQDVRIIH